MEREAVEAGGAAQRDEVTLFRRAATQQPRVQALVEEAHAVIPQAQVRPTVVPQAVGRLGGARVAGVDRTVLHDRAALVDEGHETARRGIVDEVVPADAPTVEGRVVLGIGLRASRLQVPGDERLAPPDRLPLAGRRLVQSLSVHVEAIVDPVEDLLHQAAAVEVVVEVVRARPRAEQLEGLQDAQRRE